MVGPGEASGTAGSWYQSGPTTFS